jgi:hypothetical protein
MLQSYFSLDAPYKDFVYVEVSIMATYSGIRHEKDPASTKFWLELTGLATPAIRISIGW